MSAPTFELTSSAITVPETGQSLCAVEDDVALDALRMYFGSEVEVLGYGAQLRKDYVGDASSKCQVGDEMFITAQVSTAEGVAMRTLSEYDIELGKSAQEKLGALANRSWYDSKLPQWFRDYGRGAAALA